MLLLFSDCFTMLSWFHFFQPCCGSFKLFHHFELVSLLLSFHVAVTFRLFDYVVPISLLFTVWRSLSVFFTTLNYFHHIRVRIAMYTTFHHAAVVFRLFHHIELVLLLSTMLRLVSSCFNMLRYFLVIFKLFHHAELVSLLSTMPLLLSGHLTMLCHFYYFSPYGGHF